MLSVQKCCLKRNVLNHSQTISLKDMKFFSLGTFYILYIHLNKLINEHFTNSFFLTKTPNILNESQTYYEHFNGAKFISVLDSFHSFYIFGVQKSKKSTFLVKTIFLVIVFFFKLKCRCVRTGQGEVKKKQTPNI